MTRAPIHRTVRDLRRLSRAIIASGPAIAAIALSACRDDAPLAPHALVPGRVAAAGVVCTATRASGRLTCASSGVAIAPTSGGALRAAQAGFAAAFPVSASGVRTMNTVVIGGQDRSLRLLPVDSRFNGTGDTLSASMQLHNLLSQAIGTTDGVLPVPGAVQAYFFSGPTTADPGIVTVVSPDSAVFPTGSDRLPYFKFDAPIAANALSHLSAWKFAVPTTVTSFTFAVFVYAPLQDESAGAQQPGRPVFVGLAVSAFGTHACALRPTFALADSLKVYCWGEGIGAGKPPRDFVTVPQSVGGYEFTQIFAHDQQRCGLAPDGIAYCWGLTYLATGFNVASSTVPVAAFAGHRFRSLLLGEAHDCGIATDSTAWCTGDNSRGQLGNGTSGNAGVPLTEVAGHLKWISLTAGVDFTCGLARDSTAYCWGGSDEGQLGGGNLTARTTPTVVAGGFRWRAIAAGAAHVCGITLSQAMYCWGNTDYGVLGNGYVYRSYVNRPDSVLFAPTWIRVASGDRYACGVNALGTYCWGNGNSGQTGIGFVTGGGSDVPTFVTAEPYVELALSWSAGSTCALAADHTVVCWGENSEGQLGLGFTSAPLPSPQPPVSGNYSHVAMGDDGPCAISDDGRGRASCWGSSFNGEIGDGVDASPVGAPRGVLTPVSFTSVVAGGQFSCGLHHQLGYCWGSNTHGELGDGSTIDHDVPAIVDLVEDAFTSIAAGRNHACGLTQGGSVVCWGSNADGQLGDSTTNDAVSPTFVRVPPGVTFVRVYAGGAHSCALDTTGTAWCWGDNSHVQLGDGSGTQRLIPTRVTHGLHFSTLSAGAVATCGIEANTNRLICWGGNDFGQQGTGQLGSGAQPNPAAVPTSLTFRAVTLSEQHACALTTSGFAYCWGYPSYPAALGTDPNRTALTPTRVLGNLTFADIGAGSDVTCATTMDGKPYCWGNPAHTGTGDVNAPLSGPQPVLLPGGGDALGPVGGFDTAPCGPAKCAR